MDRFLRVNKYILVSNKSSQSYHLQTFANSLNLPLKVCKLSCGILLHWRKIHKL